MLAHNPIRDWLNTAAWALPKDDDQGGIRSFGALLNAHGIPARRLRIATPVLHPEFKGYAVTWDHNGDRVDEVEVPHDVRDDDPLFINSPLHAIFFEGAHAVRCRPQRQHRPCSADPMDRGMTDFASFRMSFLRLPTPDGAFSIATDVPGGFTAEQLTIIDDFMPALSHVAELYIMEEMTTTLMQTYLGQTPGQRVMKGQIRRGDGLDIHAVIWFSDLRNSTRLSALLPRAEYLSLLNRYFDCVAEPVLDHGGEVLRYIGDAALAIFPAARSGPETQDACLRAEAAAREARQRLAALNAERGGKGLFPIDFGIGLHLGEVTYGNIGVPRRLEFTVIGEAANRAARLQDQSKVLNCPLVVSEDFARAHGGRWQRLGFMDTRELADGAAVFGPADD
ncbi:adenylate/guanylate cyclase domain-containing protein [Oleispirillum naphthae]|uniref:adenylate/guanylate cyclase domain-containing protein n=1 Tax=Oleispirillum naphthae TaxID=2838853 RepID=UPI0030824612